jgi:uncharacterized protein (TIGR02145 family)
MKLNLKLILVLWAITFLSNSCKKKEQIDAPQVINAGFSEIVYNAVTMRGEITSDGGAQILSKGACWSTQPNPTIADGIVETEDGFPSFSVKVEGLESNIKYYFRTFATNIEGTEYGEEISTTLWLNVPSGVAEDYDGNKYAAIRIGNQLWLQENLSTTHYQNGEPLVYLSFKNDSKWLANTSGAYCYFNDDVDNGRLYGYLYNGFTVMDDRNICPEGWRVPKQEDFSELSYYLGGIDTAGDLLKSIGSWEDQNSTSNNLSGFSSLPSGFRIHGVSSHLFTQYASLGSEAFFWTTNVESNLGTDWVWYMKLRNLDGHSRIANNMIKTCGLSIRCIKNTDEN